MNRPGRATTTTTTITNNNNNNNNKQLKTGNVVDKTADLSADDPMRVVPGKAVMWHYHTAFLVESGW